MKAQPSAESARAQAGGTADRPADLALRSLVHAFGLIERVMQPYFARFGVTGSQWGVLRTLQRSEAAGEAGLRLTDLSNRLLVRPPSVTGVIDRLERLGLVARDTVPGDLRAKSVTLTRKGRELVARVLAAHGPQVEGILAGLNPGEQADLHRLLGKLTSHLEGLVAERETE
jgi:DNA-binding MarR family transcriptional regulator